MRILTIDTSAIASAALIDGYADGYAGGFTDAFDGGTDRGQELAAAGVPRVETVARFATEDTRSHAEVLAPGITSLFTDPAVEGSGLDAIVVGVGPGPFTGLRSGIAMGRTLSFAWNVPLYGAMSLDALAEDVIAAGKSEPGKSEAAAGGPGASGAAGDFVIATDARRKEVYWARYSWAGALVDGPHVGPAADVPALPVFGMGAGLYRDELEARGCTVDAGYTQAQPTAESLGTWAMRKLVSGQPLLDSTPLYLRESDAKVPGPRKRAL